MCIHFNKNAESRILLCASLWFSFNLIFFFDFVIQLRLCLRKGWQVGQVTHRHKIHPLLFTAQLTIQSTIKAHLVGGVLFSAVSWTIVLGLSREAFAARSVSWIINRAVWMNVTACYPSAFLSDLGWLNQFVFRIDGFCFFFCSWLLSAKFVHCFRHDGVSARNQNTFDAFFAKL